MKSATDENGGKTWSVTFLSNLGDVSSLVVDSTSIEGTAASITVNEQTKGVSPPFNSAEYESTTVTDLSSLSAIATSLRQGVNYYFRVAAMNAMGTGPASMANPPYATPIPQPPSSPSDVALTVTDGSTLSVEMNEPVLSGGTAVDQYKVEWATSAFQDEVQLI
ncbi:hypothetical protein TrRE_jg1654, partial [Triparma retinervis]